MKTANSTTVYLLLCLALLITSTMVYAADREKTAQGSISRPANPRPGEVLGLTTNSITAMPSRAPINTEASRPETYTLDDQTRILVGRLTNQQTNGSGGIVQSFAVDPGSRQDLKVGQRVRIQSKSGRASEITILPATPGRERPQSKRGK